MFKIKPKDCAFSICMPLTRERFDADKMNIHKDFIRNGDITWAKYESEIVQSLKKIIPDLQHMGTRIHIDVDFQEYSTLFNEANKVIILLAHCVEGQLVEFSDGLHDTKRISDTIPQTYFGFLDLCVCNPIKLAQEINFHTDNCRIRIINTEASITLWLYYYWIFMHIINENNLDYFSAVKQASLVFNKKILTL